MGQVTQMMVSPKTGEIVGELYEGDRIHRAKSDEYLKSTVELNKDEPYAKAYLRPMFDLAKALSGAELQMVYFLLPYLSYESGILMHHNGKALNRAYISDMSGLSLKTIDKILQKLDAKEVIGKHSSGRMVVFTMNPWLFMKGKRINKTLFESYKNSRWAKVKEIR